MNKDNSKRYTNHHEETIESTTDKIFPLACPKEELKWIPGWQYNMVYSKSGRNELHCIFSENMSTMHFFGTSDPGPMYWFTTQYNQKDGIINFVLTNEAAITNLRITIKSEDQQQSLVTWEMEMTAKNKKSEQLFKEDTPQKIKLMLSLLGKSLKHYCETGTMLEFGK